MDGCSNKDVGCPKLLDKQLELRLAPPGEDREESRERGDSLLSLGYFSKNGWTVNNNNGGQSQNQNQNQNQNYSFSDYMVKAQQQQQQQGNNPMFLHLQSNPQRIPIKAKESSQEELQKNAEKKVFPPPPPPANPAVPTNSSQKRSAPATVVGWPPIRSFRKNLASSSSSKPTPEPQNVVSNKALNEKPADQGCRKGLFVKINMDGVPIGRKVDVKAYDSYEKLSSAVDELFRGLLAAQRDSSAAVGGIKNNQEGEKVITGLLDGSGEYTLVYEDNEGDRMLVGDVPWHMFVSTVKRLRVLKTSEVSKLRFGSKQEKIPT